MIAAIFLYLCEGNTTAQIESAWRGGPRAASSVYRVNCPDSNKSGTAFGHRSGQIITAEHVISNCDPTKLQVLASSGATTGVTAVVSDPVLDLALLKPSVSDFVKLPLDITSDPTFTIGAQVATWGFPAGYNGLIPLLSVGHFAGVERYLIPPDTILHKWVVNGAFNRGNSGGPLIETQTAKVVGVISSKLAPIPDKLKSDIKELEENGSTEGKTIVKVLQYLYMQTQLVIGFATPNNDLKQFLQKNGVEP
jgi:S1-C subfamily serine protease